MTGAHKIHDMTLRLLGLTNLPAPFNVPGLLQKHPLLPPGQRSVAPIAGVHYARPAPDVHVHIDVHLDAEATRAVLGKGATPDAE